MLNLFCPQCGFKNEYTLNKPKFCGGCGSGLAQNTFANTVIANINSNTTAVKALIPTIETRPDNSEAGLPVIDKIQIETEGVPVNNNFGRVKLADTVGSMPGSYQPREAKKLSKSKKKEIVREFQNDCKSVRENGKVITDL